MKRASKPPVVRVITRHRATCPRRSRGQSTHSCECFKSLAWTVNGKMFMVPTGKQGIADAEVMAKAKQLEVDTGVLTPSAHTSTLEAVALFLSNKKDCGIGNKHLMKLTQIFRDEFVPFCNRRRIQFIKDVKLTDLEAWRAEWTGATTTKAKKQSRVAGFFEWAYDRDFVPKNPVNAMGRIKIAKADKKVTLALTDEQFSQLLAAVPKVNGQTTDGETWTTKTMMA